MPSPNQLSSADDTAAAPAGAHVQSDASLVMAMRRGDFHGAGIFVTRFRPILEAYARKAKIPKSDWPVCVYELLEDEAIRLASSNGAPPTSIAAYLIRAAHNRYIRIIQTASARERMHASASEEHFGVRIVASAHSQESLRMSAGPYAGSESMSAALSRLALELGASLTSEESTIMVWVSEGVQHRQIAEWLGITYDACTKRIWRLCRRLRGEAAARVAKYSQPERIEIERFMRRAGDTRLASPPISPSRRPGLASIG